MKQRYKFSVLILSTIIILMIVCIRVNALVVEMPKLANHFYNDFAIVRIDDKYGLINTKGDFIIEPIYDSLGQACKCSSECEDVVFKGEVTVAKKNDKYGIIDIKENTIIDFEYGIIEWDTDYNYWSIYDDGTYRYADSNGKIISEDELENIKIKKDDDDDGIYYTNHKQEIQHNRHKNEQLYYKYCNLAIKVNSNEYYSDITFMNNDFAVMKRVKKHEYNECEYIHKYNECKDKYSKYGIIDINGKVIIEPIYDYIYKFEEGRAQVKKNDKFGIINTKGEVIVEPIYDDIYNFNEGVAIIEKDDKWGVINSNGEVIIEPIYDYIRDFKEGMAIVRKDGREGFINSKGEKIVELTYSYGQLHDFSEGLAYYTNIDENGYIDTSGKVAFICDDNAIFYDFKEGLASFESLGDRFGYINKNGEIVIEFPYGNPSIGPYEPTHIYPTYSYEKIIITIFIFIFIIIVIIFLIFFIIKKIYKNIKKNK